MTSIYNYKTIAQRSIQRNCFTAWSTVNLEIQRSRPQPWRSRASTVFHELWRSNAVCHHVVGPILDFNNILANQKNGRNLPLNTKHLTKDRLMSNKTYKWWNSTDTLWWHVIISHSFFEKFTSFCFFSFAVFALEHIACKVCFLPCTISSQIQTNIDSKQCCQTIHSSQVGAL